MPRKGGVPENLKPFKKGDDPKRNLKGRPVRPNLDLLLDEVMGEEKDGITGAKIILMALRAKAAKGDVRAAAELLDRTYGKSIQKVESTIQATSYNVEVTKDEIIEINKTLENDY